MLLKVCYRGIEDFSKRESHGLREEKTLHDLVLARATIATRFARIELPAWFRSLAIENPYLCVDSAIRPRSGTNHSNFRYRTKGSYSDSREDRANQGFARITPLNRCTTRPPPLKKIFFWRCPEYGLSSSGVKSGTNPETPWKRSQSKF